MAIEAGEQQGATATASAPAATPPAVVDANEFAKSIVSEVAKINMQQAPMTPAQEKQVDYLKEEAEALLKEGLVDQSVAPALERLIRAAQKNVEINASKAQSQRDRDAASRQVHAELGRMVERFAQTSKNPELIRELKEKIASRAIDDYNSNPALVRRFMQNGDVDWSELEKSVVKQVSKWGKEAPAEEKPSGGPPMKNSAPSGAADVKTEISRDSLSERQLEIFNSQTDFGLKHMGLKRDDAEKRALNLISNAESKAKKK